MTYLTRPVFEFPINWASPVNKAYRFDLGEVALGFGASAFAGLQDQLVQGFEVTTWLKTHEEINTFDAFTAALTGRLAGFWFPAPFEAMKPVSVVDTTHFDIPDQGLADTWDENPDIHLFFLQADHTSVAAKITAVTDLGTGFERVTIDTAVSFLSTSTTVRRLHYVRLADDTETARFVTEGWQERTVRVVELPGEYSAYETGTKRIYLYHFWLTGPMNTHWRFTSFAADVVSNNALFQGVRPGNTNLGLEHGELRQGVSAEETLEIEAAWHASHPFALFFPIPFSQPLNVQVSETTYGAPDTVTPIFTGRVESVTQGVTLVARCAAWSTILKRKVARATIGPICNWHVFTPACGAAQWHHETAATITALSNTSQPPAVALTLNNGTAEMEAEDWFAQGWWESGTGLTFEVRSILSSDFEDGVVTLTLNAPLLHAAVGDIVSLNPGCDGQAATCRDKFNNFVNFGGFTAIPKKNLSLTAVGDADTSAGQKK